MASNSEYLRISLFENVCNIVNRKETCKVASEWDREIKVLCPAVMPNPSNLGALRQVDHDRDHKHENRPTKNTKISRAWWRKSL